MATLTSYSISITARVVGQVGELAKAANSEEANRAFAIVLAVLNKMKAGE